MWNRSMGSCSEARLERIERIHERVYHIIMKVPNRESKQPARPAKWKLISYVFKKRVLRLSHKTQYSNCPEQIDKIIDKCDNGTRNVRDNTKIES